jgi:hypothetical protein
VRRKFEPFDAETIKREFLALPSEDASSLKFAMESYPWDLGTGYFVKNYGQGLFMIKDSSHGHGRCLFFTRVAGNPERLVQERVTRGACSGPRSREKADGK